MQNRKNLVVHLICLGILCLSFIVCRYAFFDLHGMKQWPELLFFVGLLALGASFLTKAAAAPVFTSLAYGIGFAAGWLFQTDGVDPGGGRTNNFWIIWTLAFLFLIALGMMGERICFSKKPPVNHK